MAWDPVWEDIDPGASIRVKTSSVSSPAISIARPDRKIDRIGQSSLGEGAAAIT
jgi:hypothetical protein